MKKTYLGDGVYAEFDHNHSGQLILTTEDGIGITNTIFLDDILLKNLFQYWEAYKKEKQIQHELQP
jgi:hypothetical protein